MLEGTGGHSFALRFHLQPGVQASLIQEGVAVLLRLTNGHGWRLTMGEGGLLALEESINLADGISLRRAQQVVAGGVTQDGSTRLCWTLARERRAGDVIPQRLPLHRFRHSAIWSRMPGHEREQLCVASRADFHFRQDGLGGAGAFPGGAGCRGDSHGQFGTAFA